MEDKALRNHTCCFTGHRAIAPGHEALLSPLLLRAVRSFAACGVYRFAAGGALGFDTLAAEAVLSLRDELPMLRLIVIAPYLRQSSGWGPDDRFRYERIREAADDFRCLAANYDRGCMRRRNHALVDLSGVCLSYLLHRPSGTGQTVDYAVQSGLETINLADFLDGTRPLPPLMREGGASGLLHARE